MRIKKNNIIKYLLIFHLILLNFEYVLLSDAELIPLRKFFIIISFIISGIVYADLMLGAFVKRDKSTSLYIFLSIIFFIFIFKGLFANNDLGPTLIDLIVFSQIFIGIRMSKIDINTIHKYLALVSIVGIIGGIYAISIIPFDIQMILGRAMVWRKPFFYAALFWAISPMVLLSYNLNKYKKLALLYWGIGIYLNLLFLKRFILISSILLIVMLIYFKFKNEKKIKIKNKYALFALFFILIIGLVLSFNTNFIELTLFNKGEFLINSTITRFEDINYSKLDRTIESINYLNDLQASNFLTGNGAGYYHTYLGNPNLSLHNGWINLLYKGGIFYLSFFVFSFIKAILSMIKLREYNNIYKFYIAHLILVGISFFYGNAWDLTPSMAFISLSATNVIFNVSSKDKKHNNKL